MSEDMIQMDCRGQCKSIRSLPNDVSSMTCIDTDVGNVTLQMHGRVASTYEEVFSSSAFQMPLPPPFGSRILVGSIVWSLKSEKGAENLSVDALGDLFNSLHNANKEEAQTVELHFGECEDINEYTEEVPEDYEDSDEDSVESEEEEESSAEEDEEEEELEDELMV